ncbi:uncharacterized protein LOC122316400 [Carya illinoinensis]|uniref:uncharacterized protein LOC122316400 n=1 Tax=Carya illinoinensis TaxID=32201 RepID=UPI001C725A90|nr:uncharacterized protein LOC122316400 [Carya illinoinensis]
MPLNLTTVYDFLIFTDAVPNKILRTMNVPGLTRENVASHLQKYRNILKKQSAAVIEKELHGEPADSKISSGNSNSKKSYGTAYRAMREELLPAGDFVDHLGNIISRSEALDRSPINICPTGMKERNLKPRDHQLEMFQYYLQSPGHSIGQIQQGRIHSHHVYENLPPTPLPTKTYHLPVLADHFNFPNIFPGIKLHDGSMGISSQPFSYRIGNQGDAGSTRPPPSSSLLDHEVRYSIVDQAAGASSTRLYPYRPADDRYSPPSQMLVDASIHMGSTSHQHASLPRPLQNFVLDCPDYMQYAAMSDLKGKGKAANTFQYFPEHGNAESGSHHCSSGFTDDDLAAIVEEFTRDDAPQSCDHDRL